MAREFFKNLPNTTTPLTATRINGLLDGDEAMGNIIVDSISSKNLISGWYYGGINSTDGSDDTTSTARRTDYMSANITSSLSYKLSGLVINNASMFVAAYNANKVFLGRTGAFIKTGTTNLTLTPSSFTSGTPQGTGDIKYLRILLYTPATGYTIDEIVTANSNMQLEKGNTATSFAPHQNLNYVSGSNANGNYIKYDDGTLICWNRITYSESVAVTTSSGALYRSSAITPFPNYPYTFIEAPAVSFEYLSDTGNHFLWIVKANSATATAPRGIYLFCPTSNTCSDVVLSYIAIGRWK